MMLDKVKRLTRTDAAPEVLAATEKSTTTLEAGRRRREPVFPPAAVILERLRENAGVDHVHDVERLGKRDEA